MPLIQHFQKEHGARSQGLKEYGSTTCVSTCTNPKSATHFKDVFLEMPAERKEQLQVHLGDTPHILTERDFDQLARKTEGPGTVNGLTHHIYNLGAGVDANLINKVQDPFFLDQIAQTFKDVSESVKLYGPWTGAWVGESGGAYNSGGKHVSHTFANGFWYLDQLGMTSIFYHKVYYRQAD